MDQKTILQVLNELKSAEPKRNFVQSYDFIINLKNIDIKKTEQQLDFFVNLHNTLGKKRKVGAFVGPELLQQAQQVCDKTISIEQFNEYKDKKSIKKLANELDFFIAQATIMPKVALQFGKILGPRGKMPNPKLGCVVPPTANLKMLYEKLQKTVLVKVKSQPVVQVMVGTESMPGEEVADNILTVYNGVILQLPSEKNNIKSVYIKTTMGKPIRLDSERAVKIEKISKLKKKVQQVLSEKPEIEEQKISETKETSREEDALKKESKENPKKRKERTQ